MWDAVLGRFIKADSSEVCEEIKSLIEKCKENLFSKDFKPREVIKSLLDLSKAINEGIGDLRYELRRVRKDYDAVNSELKGIREIKDDEKKAEGIQQVVEKARKIICGFGDDGSDSHCLLSIVNSTSKSGVFQR